MNHHRLTCKAFQFLEADWLGGRLSAEHSKWMATHRDHCVFCARETQAEAQIRQNWEDGSAAIPMVDLWPRLSIRLDELERTPSLSHRDTTRRVPRWAMGGVVVLTVLAVFGLHQLPLETTMNGHGDVSHAPIVPTVSENTVARRGQSATWSYLDDAAQNNLTVDDPVGVNMENVWTAIKTNSR